MFFKTFFIHLSSSFIKINQISIWKILFFCIQFYDLETFLHTDLWKRLIITFYSNLQTSNKNQKSIAKKISDTEVIEFYYIKKLNAIAVKRSCIFKNFLFQEFRFFHKMQLETNLPDDVHFIFGYFCTTFSALCSNNCSL